MDPRAGLAALPVLRRQLLAGAAVGGGLAVGWWLWPRRYSSPLVPGPNEHGFGGWLTIAEDGVVTVALPQLEMGQGVTTVLAQVVAVELGADWRQVAIEPAPPAGLFANTALAAKWVPLWSRLHGLAEQPVDLTLYTAKIAPRVNAVTSSHVPFSFRPKARHLRYAVDIGKHRAKSRWGTAKSVCARIYGVFRAFQPRWMCRHVRKKPFQSESYVSKRSSHRCEQHRKPLSNAKPFARL